MRIEMIGLPGVGKTTLAKAVCSDKSLIRENSWMLMDDVLLDWYKLQGDTGTLILLNSLMSFSRFPFIGRQLKLKIFRKIRACAYKQLSETNDKFNPCNDFFIKAVSSAEAGTPLQKIHGVRAVERPIIVSRITTQFFRNKFILLDEGLGVRINTLAGFKVPIRQIKQYCELIPEPDGYITMTLGDDTERDKRLNERGDSDFVRTYFKTHTEAMQAGLDSLIGIIHKKNIPCLNVDAHNSIETNVEKVKGFAHQLC